MTNALKLVDSAQEGGGQAAVDWLDEQWPLDVPVFLARRTELSAENKLVLMGVMNGTWTRDPVTYDEETVSLRIGEPVEAIRRSMNYMVSIGLLRCGLEDNQVQLAKVPSSWQRNRP